MNTPPDPTQPAQPSHCLCPKSKAAIDALVESCFDHQKLDTDHRARCQGLTSLLAKLQKAPVPCCCADESIERTMARIAAAQNSRRYDLSDQDADALELLVAHGWDARKVPSAVRARAERQAQLLSLLNAKSAPAQASSADALVQATLARIQAESTAQTRRYRLHEPAAAQRRSLKLTDIAAIAALLIVAVSVAWPAMSSVRQKAQQTACFGNFATIGQALAQYAQKSNDSLPMASASIAGTTWWNVGKPEQSNSANLFNLVPGGFLKPQQMACCGNACAKTCEFTDHCRDWHSIEQVSYSFQNLFARERPTFNGDNNQVVLADRNPAVLRAARGERVIYINENSPNHKGQGQNLLYLDGHARWATTPYLTNSGENIWLPRSVETAIAKLQGSAEASPFKGVEEPEKADVFLIP